MDYYLSRYLLIKGKGSMGTYRDLDDTHNKNN